MGSGTTCMCYSKKVNKPCLKYDTGICQIDFIMTET